MESGTLVVQVDPLLAGTESSKIVDSFWYDIVEQLEHDPARVILVAIECDIEINSRVDHERERKEKDALLG